MKGYAILLQALYLNFGFSRIKRPLNSSFISRPSKVITEDPKISDPTFSLFKDVHYFNLKILQCLIKMFLFLRLTWPLFTFCSDSKYY